MIAFLIGGEGRFMDAMINKLNKDGHRVYLLTGTKNSHTSYQKVFEKYNFEYDSDSIREILVSANPDIVIFMGAHDTRYDWENPRKTSVQFTADLTNVISAYSSVKKGRFLYISSQEVFGRSYIEDIKEDEPVSAANFRALALAQGEEICKSYYNTRGMQSIIVRMDNLYGTPKKGKKEKYSLIDMLDRNLIGDGICDMISGVVGGPAGTNYGENISTMAITKVFSVPVLIVAAIIAMIVSFFTPLIQVIYGIPLAVIGGLEIYLFGAIAAQGIAIMIEKKVDMFSSKNIAVIASIMIIGIGGNYAFGGNIPFFGIQVPCIAGAAIFGILLNLLLSIGEKKKSDQA